MLQVANNLSWQKGSHALKFGGEFRRDALHYIDLRSLNGELNFADGRYTGFGLGDFLLGLSSAQRLTLFHEPDLLCQRLAVLCAGQLARPRRT